MAAWSGHRESTQWPALILTVWQLQSATQPATFRVSGLLTVSLLCPAHTEMAGTRGTPGAQWQLAWRPSSPRPSQPPWPPSPALPAGRPHASAKGDRVPDSLLQANKSMATQTRMQAWQLPVNCVPGCSAASAPSPSPCVHQCFAAWCTCHHIDCTKLAFFVCTGVQSSTRRCMLSLFKTRVSSTAVTSSTLLQPPCHPACVKHTCHRPAHAPRDHCGPWPCSHARCSTGLNSVWGRQHVHRHMRESQQSRSELAGCQQEPGCPPGLQLAPQAQGWAPRPASKLVDTYKPTVQ